MPLRLIVFFLFLSLSCLGQVDLLIEDDENHLFDLGINGYLQNTEPVNKLIVNGIDTGQHFLLLRYYTQDTLLFRRPIRLSDRGKHHLVITQNFKGERQIRYRGIEKSYPNGIIAIPYQELKKWEDNDLIVLAQKSLDTLPLITYRQLEDSTEAISNDTLVSESTKLSQDTLTTTAIDSSSLRAKADSTKNAIIEDVLNEKLQPFPLFYAQLKASEFEFEKLKMAISYLQEHELSVAEAKKIAQQMNYDNSRYQFIEAALTKITNKGNTAQLADVFQFELTRNRFKKTLREQ